MAYSTCYTWMKTSGEVETQLYKIIEQDTWLKKVTSSKRSFLDSFDLRWFDCNPQIHRPFPLHKGHQNPYLIVLVFTFDDIIAPTSDSCKDRINYKALVLLAKFSYGC